MQSETLGKGEDWEAEVGSGMPLKRLLSIDEVARLALYLLSDFSGLQTGTLTDLEQAVLGAPSGVRLNTITAARLPAAIRRPAYDRALLRPGILHIGLGAFHRCHQAEYTDDALETAFGDWGIVGVNLRPPAISLQLDPQDGLYCRELRDNGRTQRRLIGAVIETISVLDAAHDEHRLSLQRAISRAAAPDIRLISMTVTEKGYCHVPATGALDDTHTDILHDIADPAHP
eukprot:gene59542-81487_t